MKRTLKPVRKASPSAGSHEAAVATVDLSKKKYDISMGVTQSMLGGFTKCRVAAKLSLEGWQSPWPRRATQFGSLFHALLQEWYSGSYDRVACTQAHAMRCFQTVAKKWEIAAAKAGDKVDDVQADFAMAKALFPAYVQHYKKSDAKKVWVEVEQVFDLPELREDGPAGESEEMLFPRLRGKVDGVFQYAKQNSLWVLETKTASEISEDTLNAALAFDFQCLFYLYALTRKLQKPFAGVLYNVIRKPSIGKKDDKRTDEYVEKIRDDICSRPDFYFARFELHFSKALQERFAKELQLKCGEFRDWLRGEIPTYANESACRGKWNCEYLQVCAAGRDPVKASFDRKRILFRELADD